MICEDLYFPVECGDTNALKLEKFWLPSSIKKMLVLPYHNSLEVKLYIFRQAPVFFEYIEHKKKYLNQKNKQQK